MKRPVKILPGLTCTTRLLVGTPPAGSDNGRPPYTTAFLSPTSSTRDESKRRNQCIEYNVSMVFLFYVIHTGTVLYCITAEIRQGGPPEWGRRQRGSYDRNTAGNYRATWQTPPHFRSKKKLYQPPAGFLHRSEGWARQKHSLQAQYSGCIRIQGACTCSHHRWTQ